MALKRKPPKGNVRRVHSNGKTITGVISNHQNELVQFESASEQILPIIFMRDKSIVRLVSQPIEIPFIDATGKTHKYTPDYLVEKENGVIEIHEFTMSNRRISKQCLDRENAAKQYCKDKGWQYFVHTEIDFEDKTWNENLQALFGFLADCYRNEEISEMIFTHIRYYGKTTYSLLYSKFVEELGINKQLFTESILHLIYLKELGTDLHQPIFIFGDINPKMELWIPEKWE